MKRPIGMLAAAAVIAVAAWAAPATAGRAEAAGCIQFSRISYDSPGWTPAAEQA